ncbi:MAG: membrane protein insertion efficiency factor YidD [Bacteriovoracaceae bacterium]|nr:membrane protein insertion efficiency factor YidD [Bacteriovoracaceae bacterium]
MLKKLAILLIKVYQVSISPVLGSNCRYTPTCSQYSIMCFESLPFFKAVWYSFMRIIKCAPYTKGGYDPVPPSNK